MVKIWPEIASFNDLKASAIQPHWILGNILNRVTSSFPRILNYFQISKANTHSVQFTPIFPPPHFTTLTHPHAHPRTHAHSHTCTHALPLLVERRKQSKNIPPSMQHPNNRCVQKHFFHTILVFEDAKSCGRFSTAEKTQLGPQKSSTELVDQKDIFEQKSFTSKHLQAPLTFLQPINFKKIQIDPI